MEEMRDAKPRFAVVDLRFNGGGTDATADFAESLPGLLPPDGRIYVITSAETFSAGIGAVAEIKHFGGDQVLVVGEPVGDRLRFYANGGTKFQLPNSRIPIRVWSSVEDYREGCWDWGECFWMSPFFRREGVGNLDPDIPVSLSFWDYVEGRDPVMEMILEREAGDEYRIMDKEY